MALKIKKDGDIWQLPDNFHLTDIGFRKRMKPTPKAFSEGGVDEGDGMIDTRYLSLEGGLSAKTDSEYDNKWNELVLKIIQKDFYLQDGDWRILIHGVRRYGQTFPKGLRKRLGEIEIELVALDPFWYWKEKPEQQETISEDPHEWNITNNGDVEVHPVITITNNTAYAAIQLKNKSDGNLLFSYNDTGFVSGQTVVIDCIKGTVYRGETNVIRFFSGSFLRLLAGVNSMEFSGLDDAIVKHEWYQRKL